ncbi:hypothetical protein ASPZODRAFT_112373 [Penicilliopsis zonata CBS 506.65]|uniref:Uncharacterized protein n=1 Tax=Penicilliopsis zonata CBS 506.65 TaxID=1073090 RepID=A0A1L9SQQ0_9EURO|nr:hypothetical protein ASPZODRAFT_112373 [Penicilliopsis zonata CBS 506.65]OJJ49433.1 hypothetical protein ASPZODRAFT_112373 [Penicilliopsis zonata CBS 506.65]
MVLPLPVSRPNLSIITSDLWPSMSNVVAAPWRGLSGHLPANGLQRRSMSQSPARRGETQENIAMAPRLSLPECLGKVSLDVLERSAMIRPVHPSRFSSRFNKKGKLSLGIMFVFWYPDIVVFY